MKKALTLLCTITLFSCGTQTEVKDPQPVQKSDPQALLDLDKEFSKMSLEKGMKEAVSFYAADDVIKLLSKEYPVKGKEALKELYEGEDQPQLTWQTVKAEIAASGDMGYTFGNWEMVISDSVSSDTFYGNYMTVWKKQADGSWKFVLDGGVSSPKPGAE